MDKQYDEIERLRAAISKCNGELGCDAYKLARGTDDVSSSSQATEATSITRDADETTHAHDWKNVLFRVSDAGPEKLDICKCGVYRIRVVAGEYEGTAENGLAPL
jgi:hypothetical protein